MTRREAEILQDVVGGIALVIVVALTILLIGCAPSVVSRAVELDPNVVHYTPTTGSEMQPALDSLGAIIAAGGYTVRGVSEEQMVEIYGRTAFGINDRMARTIYLNSNESVNTQFETLAHEAGHIFHGGNLDRPTAEVFAELVGNRVQRHYGSKTAVRTSSDYLAQFKHAFAALPFLQADMDRAVEVLTGKRPWPSP